MIMSDFYMDYMDVYQWQHCVGYVHIPNDLRYIADCFGNLQIIPFCAEYDLQQFEEV